MKKSIVILFILFSISTFLAQTNNRWSDLFSYNNVLAFKENNGKIIAATENGVFYYNTSTGEITKLSKATGLHEVKISAFDYDVATNTAIVGYKSGNLDVITEEGIFYIVDIPLSQSYTGSKTINHISINGDKAVISVGYGVSIFNISKREFGDTCFFFNGVSYEKAMKATIKDNTVYAVTGNGMKYHVMDDATFSLYNSWLSYNNLAYNHIASSSIIVLGATNAAYFGNIGSFNSLPQYYDEIMDIKVDNQNIIIADRTKVYIYNLSGNLQKTVDVGEKINSANIVNGQVYSGSKYSGILDENKVSYKPDGPYSNTSYKLNLLDNQIWISSGARDGNSDPIYNLLGYYHFDGTKWIYPEYFKTSSFIWNVLDVVPNPANPKEVFFTNYSFYNGEKGIYKMQDDNFVKAYAQTDSSPYFNRVNGCVFDENNQLFCGVSAIVKNNDTSNRKEGFYVYNSQSDQFVINSLLSTGDILQKPIVKNSTLFVPSSNFGKGGLIISDYKSTPLSFSDDTSILIDTKNGLPSNGAVSVAIDKNDDLWIGTRLGLRVMPFTSKTVTDTDNVAEPIIITQNGIPEELFKDLNVTQIEVDSGNQKWVSIDGGGVFYLSSNGETTLAHFTKSNSPLPSDTVTDIKVDASNGKVYFVTYDGVVVYQGDVINASSEFGDVKVYPNPVITAQYKGSVKISGLAEKTNIRITDAAGNVVHQAIARGGYYEWNLNNTKGVKVASGIYFVLMTNEDGTDKATAKIAVVN